MLTNPLSSKFGVHTSGSALFCRKISGETGLHVAFKKCHIGSVPLSQRTFPASRTSLVPVAVMFDQVVFDTNVYLQTCNHVKCVFGHKTPECGCCYALHVSHY